MKKRTNKLIKSQKKFVIEEIKQKAKHRKNPSLYYNAVKGLRDALGHTRNIPWRNRLSDK